MSATAALRPLVRRASGFYGGAGRFARNFAAGKLGGDPVFAAMLAHDLLAGCQRILDLGCGQGLLAAWLLAAARCYGRQGSWSAQWPEPPVLRSYRGIEINAHEVARGRQALGAETAASVQIVAGDIRDVDYGTADAVVILDVLHYIDHEAQETVLQRVRAALPTQGLLLLRVGDPDAGWRSRYSNAVDSVVVFARRGYWPQLCYRTLAQWQALLERSGFTSRTQPMSAGTLFANVLFVARAR
jgi:cyclopropane fatty-acyl-phospholipid synthase-like methyltransferase